MQCSPSQIEEKRRLAQQKLASKGLSPQATGRYHFQKHNNFQMDSVRKTKPYEKPVAINQFYKPAKVITAKCVLLTRERFLIKLSAFSKEAIDTFKLMPTRNYDLKTKDWDFHMKDYDELMTKLQNLRPNLVTEKFPAFVLKCLKSPKPDVNLDLSRLDPELSGALMEFQKQGLKFGIDKNGRCLIADDMGLGKTFQALAIVNYYKDDWPLLIVTTASMQNVWVETIQQYMPSVPLMHIQYMMKGREYIGDSKILIVSHDMMSRSLEKLLQRNFGAIIIDESHVLKNSKAKCTQSAMRLAKQARRVILLSGTPVLSRPSELFSQISLLDDKFFGNFFEYSKRYCDGKTTPFGWDANGKSNLQELEIILGIRFMIRRTKDQVMLSLPVKTQEVITLDVKLEKLSETERKCLSALAENCKGIESGSSNYQPLLPFFSETARIKIPSVCSYILEMLEGSQKFLVFAHHQKMLDAIENVVKQKKLKYIRIDGHTTSLQRKYFVDKFQMDEDYQCAVLSITAANAGITLTAAQVVLFAELHWNPSILSQAESRAHRIGQESNVIVKYLLAPKTADDIIWPLLRKKQKILAEVGMLGNESYEDVTVFKQNSSTDSGAKVECSNDDIMNALNCDDVFDDGLDDALSNLDF